MGGWLDGHAISSRAFTATLSVMLLGWQLARLLECLVLLNQLCPAKTAPIPESFETAATWAASREIGASRHIVPALLGLSAVLASLTIIVSIMGPVADLKHYLSNLARADLADRSLLQQQQEVLRRRQHVSARLLRSARATQDATG